MFDALLQLTILFFVIIDPLASFMVFITASSSVSREERRKMAFYAISVAASLSFVVLFFGVRLLELFSATIDEFRIAGGIILGILGIKMAMGKPLMNLEDMKNNTGMALAAVIGTPLITGPAAIIAIIVSVSDYGVSVVAVSVSIVLLFTWLLFNFSDRLSKFFGKEFIQVTSTILGLITITWGVKFVVLGIKNSFFL